MSDQRIPRIQEFHGVAMTFIPTSYFMMENKHNLAKERPVHIIYFGQPLWINLIATMVSQFFQLSNSKNASEDHNNWLDPIS